MAFDLATAKEKLSITDDSKDTIITAVINTSIAMAERYCDRKFIHGTEKETWMSLRGRQRFQMERYPIETIDSVVGTELSHIEDLEHGVVQFQSGVCATQLTIEYTGGYAILPDDLEMALWQIFNVTYSLSDGSAVVGGVSKVAITGVGSIDFQSSSVDTSNGMIGPVAAEILNGYKRYYS